MNDPLEILFQELTDTLEDSLPSAYWKHRRLRDRREDALLETLDQRQLLEDYQESEWDCTEQRERAVFLAAFQLARALRQASSSAFLAVFFAAGFFAAGFLAVVVFFAAVFLAVEAAVFFTVFFTAGFFVAVSAADCSAASSAAPSVLSWAGLRG